jgi:hypothetical protein
MSGRGGPVSEAESRQDQSEADMKREGTPG